MSVALRCQWVVTAGILPGEPQAEFTRAYSINSKEWEDTPNKMLLLLTRAHEAVAYTMQLQINSASGLTPNWVRAEFAWM
jgi:hypothetical protein